MNEPITITATVAVWCAKYNLSTFNAHMQQGNSLRAAHTLTYYGPTDHDTFGDFIRMGEADITVRLIPKDEQTRRMVQALQAQLAEERVKWHQRQEAILAEISKLSALEYVEAA
jgi:hypothetical protein